MSNTNEYHTHLIDPRNYGARADGSHNDGLAIQAAIDAAHHSGGGMVRLSGGVFRSATLCLKSNVTLEVTKGARLEALPEPDLYPYIEPGIRSRMDTVAWRAFIYAFDQDNLSLCGEGIIDGHGEHDAFKENLKGNDPFRPYGIHLVGCRNVRMRDLTLRNSAFWMLRCFGCTGVDIRDLNIWNHADTRNNDGCDIDGCHDVTVSGCRIDSCDDALCFKSEGKETCENITVANCVLASFASPLKFGTGSIGGFRNISVGDITIKPSACTHNHHVFEADGGLAGIDVGNVDGGFFENVTINNVAMRGPECPIFIKLGKRHSFNCHDGDGEWPDEPEVKPGSINGLHISNVVARDVGPYPCIVMGYEGNPAQDISFTNVSIRNSRCVGEEVAWETVEIAPERYPVTRCLNSVTPAYGLCAAHVEGLTLHNVRFVPEVGEVRKECELYQVKKL